MVNQISLHVVLTKLLSMFESSIFFQLVLESILLPVVLVNTGKHVDFPCLSGDYEHIKVSVLCYQHGECKFTKFQLPSDIKLMSMIHAASCKQAEVINPCVLMSMLMLKTRVTWVSLLVWKSPWLLWYFLSLNMKLISIFPALVLPMGKKSVNC